MKRAMISIEQWAKKNSMKLNMKKCGIQRLNKKSNKAQMEHELQVKFKCIKIQILRNMAERDS